MNFCVNSVLFFLVRRKIIEINIENEGSDEERKELPLLPKKISPVLFRRASKLPVFFVSEIWL